MEVTSRIEEKDTSTTLRRAIVIGNSDYELLMTPLTNAINDAEAIGMALHGLGFKVTNGINKNRDEIFQCFNEVYRDLKEASEIVFFYAGHGVSIGGSTYLAPVDAKRLFDNSINQETLCSLNTILQNLLKYRANTQVPIIIIMDCCRSEPDSGNSQDQDQVPLQEVRIGSKPNIAIIYSTTMGEAALDNYDSSKHSPFTELLLENIVKDHTIFDMDNAIRRGFEDSPKFQGIRQMTWMEQSLLNGYSFYSRVPTVNSYEFSPISLPLGNLDPLYGVPNANKAFADRPSVLKKMNKMLWEGSPSNRCSILALNGLGGMGKTQLMLQYCYLHRPEYDYVFWMRVDGRSAAVDSFRKLSINLGFKEAKVSKEDLEQKVIEWVRYWLENKKKWLLLLDNADERMIKEGFEDLPRFGGHIILTTREPVPINKANVICVEKMEKEEALSLLFAPKSLQSISRQSNQFRNAENIVAELDCMPLAINLARAYIKNMATSFQDYLHTLKSQQDFIFLHGDDDSLDRYNYTLATVWKLSFESVRKQNPAAALILNICAFLRPYAIPVSFFKRQHPTLERALGILSPADSNQNDSTQGTVQAIAVLIKFSFVTQTLNEDKDGEDPAYNVLTIHRLVQAFLLHYMEPPIRLQLYNGLISALSQDISPEFQLCKEHFGRTMDAYVPHIRHVIRQLGQLKDERHIISKELTSLLSATVIHLTRQGLFKGVEDIAKLCVEISEERKDGQTHPDTAATLSNLSYLYISQSRFEDAEPHCLQALRIRRRVLGPMNKDTISALHGLAYIYSRLGKETYATQLYWEAAIVGDQEAQGVLAYRYYRGIGAPIHEEFARYWKKRSIQDSSNKSEQSNDDLRLDLTPLHHAILQNNVDKIRNRTTDYKQYASAGDRNGQTPLHLAAESANIEIMRLVIEWGLDTNIKDNNGQTPLHLAAGKGHIEIVRLLIAEPGIDISIEDNHKKTPAELASEKQQLETAKLISRNETLTKLAFQKISSIFKSIKKPVSKSQKEDLEWNVIDFKDAKSLNQTNAITLELIGISLGVEGIKVLANFLKLNTTLTELNLCDNEVGVEGTYALTKCLKQNATLTTLNLYMNKIGADGARALAKYLVQNATLTDLYLFKNGICDNGVCALADCLKQNATLTKLSLNSNEIGDKGACALAECLKLNTTLTNLHLQLNEIGDEGAYALAECLKKNTTLTNLNLQHNKIGVEGTHFMTESLKENTTIALDLAFNDISTIDSNI